MATMTGESWATDSWITPVRIMLLDVLKAGTAKLFSFATAKMSFMFTSISSILLIVSDPKP